MEGAKVAPRSKYFHVRPDKTSLYTVATYTLQVEPIVELRQERLAMLCGMSAMKKITFGYFYDGKANVFMPPKLHDAEMGKRYNKLGRPLTTAQSFSYIFASDDRMTTFQMKIISCPLSLIHFPCVTLIILTVVVSFINMYSIGQ